MAQSVMCPCCRVDVTPKRPSLLDKALIPFGWLYCIVMVSAAGVTGPFLFTIAPVLMLAGGCMMRTAYDRAYREPHCPRCNKDLAVDAVETKESTQKELALV